MDPLFWTFLIPITLLTITPGVDTVLIIRNTTRGGWRDGVLSSLGICCGLFVHAVVSAVGISVILLQSAWAFQTLKMAGAGYLVWLGIVSLRSAARAGVPLQLNGRANSGNRFSVRRSLLEGFLSNVLNPKAVVFYMAFLPQFIDPNRSALYQSLFLAGLHPLRTVNTLTDQDIEKLAKAIQQGLLPSIDKGSSNYELDLYGREGDFRIDDIIIGYKEDQPCPNSGTAIDKLKTGSTSSFICPQCQPLEVAGE